MFDLTSQHRTVYAIDLPGYGTSERSDRRYTPRLMTDAILDLASYIRVQHGDKPIDAMAASLSCEFLARAAVEQPSTFNTLSLASIAPQPSIFRTPLFSSRQPVVLHSS